jgi:p21-activated kinase 1
MRKDPTAAPPPAVPKDPPAAPASAAAVQQRPRNQKTDGDDFVERLKAVVNPDDPTKLYRNFVKIGQGYAALGSLI